MLDHNGPPSAAAIDSLLTMLQTLRTAPARHSPFAQIESARKVRAALAALIDRAFVAFLKNALDRYARTNTLDSTSTLKIRTIRQRLEIVYNALTTGEAAPQWRDAQALEQHLIAQLWSVRRRAERTDAGGAASFPDALGPLRQALGQQLDGAVFANLDSIASLGSLEQTLRGVPGGELEEWREILHDSTREIIENYRALGAELQRACTTLRTMDRSPNGFRGVAGSTAPSDRDLLLERLNAEIRRAQRHRHPLSLALLGPDNIEDIRELTGPQAAREVLHYYWQTLASCARAYDLVTSCKPHRLLWLLPGANTDQSVSALRKAQQRIHAAHYRHAGRLRRLPTFSAAVVGYAPGEDSAHLLTRAENLAAHAKRAGPNHIEWESVRADPAARVR
jgi:diguanylate cyclase (GGDEF)-like protein